MKIIAVLGFFLAIFLILGLVAGLALSGGSLGWISKTILFLVVVAIVVLIIWSLKSILSPKKKPDASSSKTSDTSHGK